jgi:TRAP-type mannitol/chloroaromatic compound transport system substrate-binding protein
VLLILVLAAAGCGSSKTAAESLRSCVRDRLPAGAVDRVASSTVEGVTTITYFHRGSETTVSSFASDDDAKQAELAEARLGDAHDRRVGNVLYSGGGAAAVAIAACLR